MSAALNSVRYSSTPFLEDVPAITSRESLDGVLGIIVVPRHAVVTQESKKRVAVLQETLPAFQGRFTLEFRCAEKSEESVDVGQVLPEETRL